MLIPKGTRMMCYARITYAGASYVRAEEPTKGTTVYLPADDVTEFEEGSAPFAKAKCLISVIGTNVVGVNVYKQPSEFEIKRNDPLFAALGENDVFDVISVVAVDGSGKDVWGFYRVSYQGKEGYVRADEVVSVDAEPQPMPKTVQMVVKSDGLGKTVTVYKEANRESEAVGTLLDGSTIKVIEPFDPESEFTMVLYNNEICYVLSQNVGQNGLSAGQVLAIVLSVVAAIGSVLTVLILRANKKHKRSQKE